MKRLILPALALLTILVVCVGCSEDESEPVITRIHVSPPCGVADLRVDVYGAASGGDESGPATGGVNNLEYTWDFGDGTTSNTSLAYHVYETPGEYTVRLKVEDPDGKTAMAERPVIVIGDSMSVEAEASDTAPARGTRVTLDYRAMSCEINPDLPGDYRNLVQQWSVYSVASGNVVARYDGKSPTHTFNTAGSFEARLRVAYPAWAVVRHDTVFIDVN